MSLDFSQVKEIVIPEGSVKKIQINGVTIWESTPTLLSITLSGQTTSLDRDTAFSFGGTVTAHYDNESTADVTAFTTFSGYNMSTTGTYTVTASYTENGVTATTTYQLTVNKAWSAVWTGNKTITVTGQSVSGNANIYTTPTNDGFNLGDYRFTFTMSASGGGSGYTTKYTTNDASISSSTTTKPSSPYRWNTTLTHSSLTRYIVRVLRIKSDNHNYNYSGIAVNTDNTNKNLVFSIKGGYDSSYPPGSGAKTTLTITKIEKYY